MNIQAEIESNEPDLLFSPLATIDIKETWAYLSGHGEDVAANFIRSVIKVCGTISSNPTMGRDRSDLIVGLRHFPHQKYNIFYFQTDIGIEIYRVINSSRNVVQLFKDPIDDIV